MIERLRGVLVDAMEGACVLEVGGVGFSLGISLSTRSALPPLGTPDVLLYCSMRVKEDDISLYGFATREERTLFEKLVAVSGVGPKGALAILSAFSPHDLAQIVATQDTGRLTQAKGIGKKTASRLLIELEGSFKQDPLLQRLASEDAAPLAGAAEAAEASPAWIEAKEALMSLGFTEREVLRAFEGASGGETLEQLVALGLRRLGGGA